MLLVEWCAVGVDCLKIAATEPDTVDFFPCHNALVTAARTRYILPEFLESPLDASL